MATPYKFTGLYFKICKAAFNLFTKKYKFMVTRPIVPKVYVARHLDLHGAATVLKSANFCVIHMGVIHILHRVFHRKTRKNPLQTGCLQGV